MNDHDSLALIHKRLDQQDGMLREILDNMATHKAEHAAVDPSIQELVGILKGMKFMRSAAVMVAALIAGAWALLAWAKDHVRL